jgi:uncharacterized C2H2 Zn-finger protein
MQVEAKLRGVTRTGDDIKTDEAEEAKPTDLERPPPTPQTPADHEEYVDPRTGVFRVKQEPAFQEENRQRQQQQQQQCQEVHPPAQEQQGQDIPNPADFLEQDKENEILEMPVKVTVKVEPGADDANFKVPDGPAKKAKKFGKRQIFKCMECEKGFKKQSKLIRHVMKRHSDSLKKKAEEQISKDIHELTKNAKDDTGRWPCTVRRLGTSNFMN